MEKLIQDLRFAVRGFARSPGFTSVAVLTLALGIGANTAIFSVIDGVLLEPLPYPESERVVAVWELGEDGTQMHVTSANFVDWRERSRSFEALALHSSYDFGGRTTVLGGDQPVRVWTAGVSDRFFQVLGVAPVIGRAFSEDEHRAGGPRAAIVSHAFWRTRLGGAALDGLTLDVWGRRRPVVGVMPPGFAYPAETDVWLSQGIDPTEGRQAHNWRAIGRLAEGVTLAGARAEMNQITAELKAQHGSGTDAVAAALVPLQEQLSGPLRQPLVLLLGAAALVLLVACTNLASTLLARGTARERELAIRTSIGATRRRLIAQLFTENLLLALLGAAAGVGLAWLLVDTLLLLAPSLPAHGDVTPDGLALLFAGGLAVATALLFGLVPALRAAGVDELDALRSGGRGGSEGGRRRTWNVLVAGEVALALVLLAGSGLLMKSFWTVLRLDPGFRTANVLTVDLAPPETEYAEAEPRAAYFERAIDEVGALPGVARAGLINHLPLSGQAWNGDLEIDGRGPGSATAYYRIASGGFFDALGIETLRGRVFDESDAAGDGDVVVINRSMAERYWPSENPVGRRVRNLANDAWIYPDRWLTIIGVVEDTRHEDLTATAEPTVYVHYRERPARLYAATLVLSTTVPPGTLVPAVRERLRELDPDVPIEASTMASRVSDSLAQRRFAMVVLGGFAALALLLAVIGIYGVMAYTVERRTREIGIRLALGAAPDGVLRQVVREAALVVAPGLAIGLAGAAVLTRFARGMLYGVSPLDPFVFAAVVTLLGAVAIGASILPARRAARVDPIRSLKLE